MLLFGCSLDFSTLADERRRVALAKRAAPVAIVAALLLAPAPAPGTTLVAVAAAAAFTAYWWIIGGLTRYGALAWAARRAAGLARVLAAELRALIAGAIARSALTARAARRRTPPPPRLPAAGLALTPRLAPVPRPARA